MMIAQILLKVPLLTINFYFSGSAWVFIVTLICLFLIIFLAIIWSRCGRLNLSRYAKLSRKMRKRLKGFFD